MWRPGTWSGSAVHSGPNRAIAQAGTSGDHFRRGLHLARRPVPPDNVDHTVAALVASQDDATRKPGGGEAARKRLTDAEGRLRKFQAAIAAGVDPGALLEVINACNCRGGNCYPPRTTRDELGPHLLTVLGWPTMHR
jgi:hypothetical protein